MKDIHWDPVKNTWLRRHRNISFEEILDMNFIGEKGHPSRYFQNLKLFERAGSIWVVPYEEDERKVIFKTAYRSRKLTRAYHRGEL